jgi:hypothetical protein
MHGIAPDELRNCGIILFAEMMKRRLMMRPIPIERDFTSSNWNVEMRSQRGASDCNIDMRFS